MSGIAGGNEFTLGSLITFILVGAILVGIGIFIGVSYSKNNPSICEEKLFDGCWTEIKGFIYNDKNKTIDEVTEEEWVCVNIQGMDYERCLEVVAHECGHSLFAKKCENNPELCFDLMKELEISP